tara:strand:+ start:11119 stop:11673 length:555 start_codon:yes stop_codon:yes gene_type:complete
MTSYTTQNSLLLKNLLEFYNKDNNLDEMLSIINGESPISLRIVDWFVTNYAKQKFTVYDLKNGSGRFKVYNDYKLKLKAYSKKRFDPFCRWDRINIPYHDNNLIQTTIGQLNFFKWAMENEIIDYIKNNYNEIEKDMNTRNSTSKRRINMTSNNSKTRKKREELSVSASKTIKQEKVEVTIKFD